jgi:FMN reductase
MSTLLIAGSPSERSRSAALLDAVAQRLTCARRARGPHPHPRPLAPGAAAGRYAHHRSISQAVAQVAQARVLVVSTPVYKAAYSGVLKVFLDLLAQTALQGKTVLPLATGGSPHHMLALDYALRPVLQSLGAKHILPGIYATDAQVTVTPEGAYAVGPRLPLRLDDAVNVLVTEALRPVACAGHAVRGPVPFCAGAM